MERLYSSSSRRESVLLGYNSCDSKSLIRRTSSSDSNVEVDFNDVFGGPPRRSSVTEARQSVSGEEGGWCRWPAEREKPVFGEESGNRRRNTNRNRKNDFFDDIFGGEESGTTASVCSTPKKRGMGGSSPLPAAPDLVVGSLPLPFSLPAKLANEVDLQTFGSPPRSIVASNGLGPSDSHLSRFLIQRKELKNDLKSNRQSLLSQEFSNSKTSDKADKGSIMKQDISISEVSPSASSGQFHFSIYKWASKGVPMVMPLRTDRTSRTKDKAKLEKCSSAKEWMVNEITTHNPIAYNGSSLMNNRKEDVSTTSTATQSGADSDQIVEQIVTAKAQSDTSSSPQTVTKHVPASSISRNVGAVESSTHSTNEIRFNGKTEAAKETQKLEPKSLHFLFKETDKKQDYDAKNTREREENGMKSTKKSSAVFDITANPMKQEEKTVFMKDIGHRKATSQGSSNLSENMEKGQVKGKVKEFARIFNQEAVTKPKVDSKSRPQGSTYKKRDALRTKREVEGGPEQSKKENSAVETTTISNDISEPAIPDISFTVVGDKDESFSGNFMIQVLAQDEVEVLQNKENQEIQIIDNKIKQWSKGKEGNIRSLLSTLQHVLWSGCGWKPVPLVDIIEGNAVKRAYQRALLCLHPDKLQQKCAGSDQKYIAEKVFDILQEAWAQFNTLGAI